MKQKKHRFLRGLGKTLGVLLALLLAAALVLTVIPMTETVSPKTAPGSADWMKDLDGSLRLDELVLPGAHDCATQHVQLGFITKCQALSVGEQLEAGVRYLDVRLAVAPDAADGSARMELVHGFTRCRVGALPWEQTLDLARVLDQCAAFLQAHPTETVVFLVKQEYGSESVQEFQTRLDAIVRGREGLFLLTDTLPTLDEARGKLVLARRYPDAAGLGADAGIELDWVGQAERDDVAQNVLLYDSGGQRLWVQDRFHYGVEDKWTAFRAGLACADIQPGDVQIHFLSTAGSWAIGHPYAYAKDLNARLLRLPSEELHGWIVLDFVNADLCQHVWSANFE